jgi:rSAM/selenodomain-associated transferase 1
MTTRVTAPGDMADPSDLAGLGEPGALGELAAQLIVIAKEPVPGRVKTRLTPPFTPRDAALLAEAALTDTLAAAAAAPVARRVLALAGSPGPWLPAGFEVIAQSGGGLDERLGHAFADAYAGLAQPMVLIGMDTPQVTPPLLAAAVTPLVTGEADAVFGPAADGGFWLLGLRRPDAALTVGVPMSTSDTGRIQLERLRAAGLRVAAVPELTDVDTVTEAEQVAAAIPGSHFAGAFTRAAGRLALA